MPKFHQEICKIKDIFIKNGYSERFLYKCVKKQVTIVLPCMGMISAELKVKLHKTFKQLLPACYLRVTFKVSLRMKNYFNFNSQTSTVHDHMLFFKTVFCPKDFSILAKSSCNFKLEIQESILIKLLKPTLNKSISSVPLYLF